MTSILSSSIFAIALALIFTGLFRRLAVRWRLVDTPGGRKQHAQEVPLIGGIVVFCSFCLTLFVTPVPLGNYAGLVAGGGLLLVIGVVDDYRELSNKLRLLGHTAAALIMIFWGHLQVFSLGDLLFSGNIELGWLSLPVTIILVSGYLNAMNMIDGQDGLAGGVALGQVILLGYLGLQSPHPADSTVLLILGCALAVFLAFNLRLPGRSHAIIFLGDAGSTFIAFAIAWFAISIGQHNNTVQPVVMLWILSFPVFDLFQVCLTRRRQKKPILQPSPDHFHNLLRAAGWKDSLSTALLVGFSLSLGIIGILLNHWQIPTSWQFPAWLTALLAYLLLTRSMRRNRAMAEEAHLPSQYFSPPRR